ncbi:MAG: methylenetetrahydrofolate reductase [NAD(P)H] [Paludibacteraceae bacterium]|nr:methylenetetrahydrofolate reductase [NAD(P)H] [Paludibacteraceae bacterium]
MRVIDLINSSKSTAFSFELLPPLKGAGVDKLYQNIDSLLEFNPKYINITTHHSEFIQRTLHSGEVVKQNIRKRPGTVAIAAAIQNKYGITAIPHIICAGFSKAETEYALVDLQILGIHDLLVLQGDKGKMEPNFIPENESNKHAIELQGQINQYNKGYFEDGTEMANKPSVPFSYGVAGYPEKHGEAVSMDSDIHYLKEKVKAGANYVVTQMFFDNSKYFEFVARCRAEGITVPIIPGIKPIVFMNQLTVIPKIFSLTLPEPFATELAKCKTDEEAKQMGIEWSILQCKELMEAGVPSLHFYTLMATDSVAKVAKEIY